LRKKSHAMTLLSRFFGKNKVRDPVSLEYLVTDMHSHLIPGLDDGARDMETALALIQRMKELGYRKLIATPHVMSDIYRNTHKSISDGMRSLQHAAAAAGINIQLEAAAEYMVDDGLARLLETQDLMTFGDRFVLVELPYYSAPDHLNSLLFDLQVAKYKPILAHPERYGYWHQQFNRLEELKERGVYFQLNIISLSGYYSSPTKKMAEKLIEAGMIEFLGSDLHNQQSLALLEKTLTQPALEKVMISGKLLNHLI